MPWCKQLATATLLISCSGVLAHLQQSLCSNHTISHDLQQQIGDLTSGPRERLITMLKTVSRVVVGSTKEHLSANVLCNFVLLPRVCLQCPFGYMDSAKLLVLSRCTLASSCGPIGLLWFETTMHSSISELDLCCQFL